MTTNPDLVPALVETSGSYQGRTHPMPYGEHILGRGRDATVILDDPDVSRQHARVSVAHEGMTVFDLGSKNGVVVDGRRITRPLSLGHGDTLTVGDVTLRVQHPAAQVARALAAAGEATATVTNTRDGEEGPTMGLIWPILGVIGFGTAVVVLLLV